METKKTNKLIIAALIVVIIAVVGGGVYLISSALSVKDPYMTAEKQSYAAFASALGYVKSGDSYIIPDTDKHVEYKLSVQPNSEVVGALIGSVDKLDPTDLTVAADVSFKNGVMGDYYSSYDINGLFKYAQWGGMDGTFKLAFPTVDALKDVYYVYSAKDLDELSGGQNDGKLDDSASEFLGEKVTGLSVAATQDLYLQAYTYLLKNPEDLQNISKAISDKYFELSRKGAKKLDPKLKGVDVKVGGTSKIADVYEIVIDNAFARELTAAAFDAAASQKGFIDVLQASLEKNGVKTEDGKTLDVAKTIEKIKTKTDEKVDGASSVLTMSVYAADGKILQRDIKSDDGTLDISAKYISENGKTDYDITSKINDNTVLYSGSDVKKDDKHTGSFKGSVSAEAGKNYAFTGEYADLSANSGTFTVAAPDFGVKISGTVSNDKAFTADISAGGQVYVTVSGETIADTSPAKVPALPKTEKTFKDLTEDGSKILSDMIGKATASEKNDIVAAVAKMYAPYLASETETDATAPAA